MENNELSYIKKEQKEFKEILESSHSELTEDEITVNDIDNITNYAWRYINSSRFNNNFTFTESIIDYIDTETNIDGYCYDLDLIKEVVA